MVEFCVEILVFINVGGGESKNIGMFRMLGFIIGMLEFWKVRILESGSLDFLSDGFRIVECWNVVLKFWNLRMLRFSRVGMWEF